MKTLSLVSSFLPSLGFGIELFFLSTRLQVHSQIIELFVSLQVLWVLLVFLEKVVGAIMSIDKIFPILLLNFRILVLDSATQMLFILFALVNTNIVIIKVYEWSLLVSREKMILFFIIGPFERLYGAIVEAGRAQVGRASMPRSQVLL